MNSSLLKLVLLEQESGVSSQFSSQLFMTNSFMTEFGPLASILALMALLKVKNERVNSINGADYLQVFELNKIRFWLFDDGDHITALLPDEY